MKKVKIYTDGSCLGNPGPGGWGAVLKYDNQEKIIHGSERDTTNNRMELTAAYKALDALKQSCSVELYTDSNYLRQGITEWIHNWKRNGWKTAAKKPVKNADIWQEIDRAMQAHEVSWHWVKAHNGDPENEKVDRIAREAANEAIS